MMSQSRDYDRADYHKSFTHTLMSYTSNFHETFYDLQYTVKFQTDVRHRFVALAKKKYMK